MSQINQNYFDRVKYTLYHKETGTLIINEPIGWDDDDKEFVRNEEYHGVFTSFSNSLRFIESGKDFILLVDEIYGVNANIRLTKDEKHPKIDLWVRTFDGNLDLSTKEIEDNKVSLKFNSGGLNQIIKARESEQVEIDRTTSMDGKTIESIKVEKVAFEGRKIFLKSLLEAKEPDSYVSLSIFSNGNTRSESVGVPLKTVNKSHEEIPEQVLLDAKGTKDYGVGGMMFFNISEKERKLDVEIKNLEFTTNVIRDDDVNSGYYQVNLTVYKDGNNYIPKTRIELFSTNIFDAKNNLGGDAYRNRFTGVNNFPPKSHIVNWTGQINLLLGESLAIEVLIYANMGGAFSQGHLDVATGGIKGKVSVEENSNFESSTSKFVFAHELLDKLCQIYSGQQNVFRSNFFGRTDIGYSKDGQGALNGITHGFWIRGFDKLPLPTEFKNNLFKPLTTSLKDALASFNAIHNTGFGIEKVGYKEIAIVEDMKYFYNRNVAIRLPNQVKKVKRSVATKYFYSSIEIGYEKGGSYDEAFGLDESNVKSTFTTCITRLKETYTKLSKYRADSYGKEFARRKPRATDDTLDTTYDTDNWVLDLKRGFNEFFLERKYQDDFSQKPTGIYSPETAINIKFSPLNMLLRHGWVLASGLTKYPLDYLSYGSSLANSNLKTKLIGKNEYSENGKIRNSELERARYLPEYVEFEHIIDFDIMQQIEGQTLILGEKISNIYCLVEFTNENNESEKGWILSIKPNDKKFKLLKANR
jgi:hypothetical protein